MKFLLAALNAKYIHSNPAVHCLRAYAVHRKPELAQKIEIAEYTINQQSQDILADIYGKEPTVVAFSCYVWNWSRIRELTAELHKILPRVPIWLGGPEVSFDPEEILRAYPQFTGVMLGEGEETFLELIEYYADREDGRSREEQQMKMAAFWPGAVTRTGLFTVEGVVFRDRISGDIVRTGPRDLTDISRIPFFYEDLGAFRNRILYYESSRGCPFRCSYCLSSLDKRVRLRDLDLVKRELQYFLDAKVPQVKFIDRTFNCDHAHAQAIWQYLLEHDNGVTNFHFEIAADLLNRQELELLRQLRPGLVQLEIGVQTTNQRTIREIHRRMDVDRLARTVAKIREGKNIHIHLDLIAGLPYEDYESFGRSFNDVYAMRPEQLQLGFLKVLKGSYMHERAAEYGLCYLDNPPYEVLYTKWLSYGDVIRLKRVEEMVELYYNSGQFSHVLPVLEKQFESPFSMFEALAAFYEKNGYFVNSPSRIYRYQVLLDFAGQCDPAREQLYRELLVYDMYLRENLKSRPEFAADISRWYDKISDFYKKEEENRAWLPGYEECSAKQLQRMTHLEIFRWPVELQAQELLELFDSMPAGAKETAVLFDYRQRNPLNSDARTVLVQLD